MSVAKLLDEISSRREVPVPLSFVLDQIRARGIDDIINFFHDVDLDPKILRGYLHQEIGLISGKQRTVSTVTYAKMGPEMERLVCCKELLHILDPDHCKVALQKEVRDLVAKIVLPADLTDPLVDGEAVFNDRVAQLEALAILFPLAVRNHLYDSHMKGLITLGRIADAVELPLPYVATVMNGGWPRTLNLIIGNRRRSEFTRADVPKPVSGRAG